MLGKVVPRMKSKHCGAGLALSLMDLRFRMSTYVDRQPLSALSCLFLLQTDPRDLLAGRVASNAQNKGMDHPSFERLPSAPSPKGSGARAPAVCLLLGSPIRPPRSKESELGLKFSCGTH
jgi:hypothetical protein